MKYIKYLPVFLLVSSTALAENFRGVNIAPENTSVKYDRKDYGGWIDADNNGLDTRQEVLAVESLTHVTLNDDDKVVGGYWVGIYTGFVTNTPQTLDVDHMVPLKEAHRSGGWKWDTKRKKKYANYLKDPNHLIAVKAQANRSKGTKDPSKWMPPNRAYWCQYLKSWIKIKRDWGLTMDTVEASSVKKGFKVCKRYTNSDKID